MSVLGASIRQFLQVDGVRAAVLVDTGTGMIIDSAGHQDPGLPAAAASMADEVRWAARTLAGPGQGGGVDGIALVTEHRLHLLEVLEHGQGEGMLLFVDLDRSQTNVALATLQVRKLVPALLG